MFSEKKAKDKFRVKEFLVESDKVVFVYTAMGTRIGLYKLFISLMNKKGYSCIVYDYPLDLLFKPDLIGWEQFYTDIVADGQKRINGLKSSGYTHFYGYGVSMGTLIANKFTRDTSEVSHLILNLTYGDVAYTIWTYRGTRKTRKQLLKQGIDQDALSESVRFAEPTSNVEGLKGKKVLLYLAKNDRVLTFDKAKNTLDAFKSANLDLEYVENKYLGHYVGGAKNMLEIKKIDQFYSN